MKGLWLSVCWLRPELHKPGLLKRIQNQLGGSADHVVLAFARNQVIPQIDRPLLSYLGNRHTLADAKMETFKEALNASGGSSEWLGYNRFFETNIRKSGF